MFWLPSISAQSVRELLCPECNRRFYWVTSVINNVGIGTMQPPCPNCGYKDCVDVNYL